MSLEGTGHRHRVPSTLQVIGIVCDLEVAGIRFVDRRRLLSGVEEQDIDLNDCSFWDRWVIALDLHIIDEAEVIPDLRELLEDLEDLFLAAESARLLL